MTTEFDQLHSDTNAARDSTSIFLGYEGHYEIDDLGPKKKTKTTTSSGVSHGEVKYHDDYPKRPKGTTTLAFVYKEGVMIATDHSDASKDAAEHFVENVIDLDSHVIVTVSGVGDTRHFLRNLKDQYRHEHESEKGKKSFVEVSEWVAKHLSSHSDKDSSAKMLIAVWDHETNSPRLFSVNANGQSSTAKKGVTGSGSGFVRSLLRESLLNKVCAEAIGFAKWAIEATVFGLSFSRTVDANDLGRYVSGYYVAADGWTRVFHNERAALKSFSEGVTQQLMQ